MLDSVQSVSCRARLCETSHKLVIARRLLQRTRRVSRGVPAFVRVLMLAALASAWGASAWAIEAPAQTAAPAAAEAPGHAAAQPAAAAPVEHAPPAGAHAQGQAGHAAEGGHGEAHGESPLAFAGRIANFLILAGALYYFLRKPIGAHLASRDQQIRSELITAKETTATATAQLAEIDRKLQALPAEIVALKARGAEEIASEEARIRATADAERQRLIEQTRREIDLQVRLAKRALTEHAATLAVDLATTQITQTITPDDQTRLIDRYVGQVRKAQ